MDISNHVESIANNYYKSENRSQTGYNIACSVRSSVPCRPTSTVKSIVSQKMNTPLQFDFPKYPKTSFVPPPSLSTKPKALQNIKCKNVPSPTRSKSIPPDVNPTTVNLPKANPATAVCSDQWWMEYDEHLRKQ